MRKSKTNISSPLSQSHPLAKRKTLYVLDNKQGEIVALDQANFGIRQEDGGTLLLPVNLPEEFQKNGTKIKFTAQAKETDAAELWAGQPVLLTNIEKK